MPALIPLFVLASQLAFPPHHPTPVHHPYARPHHLRTHGPGPKIVSPVAPLQAAPVAAPHAAAADDEAVEEVEAVDATVAPVGALTGTAQTPDGGPGVSPDSHVFGIAPDANASIVSTAGAAAVLGHLHPAVVHLPIAWVLLWAFVELLSLISTHSALNPSALFLSLITLLSYGPSVLTGLCRLDELASATKGYDTAEAILHRNLIFVSAAVCGVCMLLRLINWRWPNMFCRLLCLMGVVAAAAITGYSAHLGGRMVYGAEFLAF